jgi:hypothetical protein
MSPDIEWHAGEGAEQETIAQITTSKPSRWRKPIVLVMAVLGLGLGALYAALPEPPQSIAPPATPNGPRLAQAGVNDVDLADTIDREARALANGDMQTFIGLLDPEPFAWRQAQISSFTPWGAPPSADEFYRILDSAQLDAQHAWADVVQARAGKFFRQTRFYRWHNGAWLRTTARPGMVEPGAAAQIATRYFRLTHTAADEDAARQLAGYLARQSRAVCRTFGCNLEERPPVTHFLLQPEAVNDRQLSGLRDGPTITVTLPSPRFTGYYTADFDGDDIDDELWDGYFDRYLYFPLLYTAVGGAERWQQNRGGLMYVYAVGSWDLTRRERPMSSRWRFPYRPELFTDTLDLASDELWQWTTSGDVEQRLANASALVQFIDETYGADVVLRFFRTLRFAQSLPHALSRSGVALDDFEQKWQAWQNNES